MGRFILLAVAFMLTCPNEATFFDAANALWQMKQIKGQMESKGISPVVTVPFIAEQRAQMLIEKKCTLDSDLPSKDKT